MAVIAVIVGLLGCATSVASFKAIPLKYKSMTPEEERDTFSFLQMETEDQLAVEAAAAGDPNALPFLQLNARFYGEIAVGSPTKQPFEVIFDTGSDVFWVYDKKCQHCNNRQKFDNDKTSSYKNRNVHFTVKYGTGETGGDTGTEKVTLGDLEVDDQVFGSAADVDVKLESFPFSGVVGMSYPMLNEPAGFVPIFDNIIKQGLLTGHAAHSDSDLEREEGKGRTGMHNQFSFFLSKRPEQQASFMFIGATDDMVGAEDLSWVPTLEKNQYWEIPFKSISLKYKTKTEIIPNVCQPCTKATCSDSGGWEGKCISSIDTGHSLISGPPDFINAVKAKISTPNGICDTAEFEKLPSLMFEFEGFDLEMKPQDYTVNMEGGCTPGLRPRDPRNGHDYVFGEHFMRSYYAVFDREKNQVGFAPSSQLADGLGVRIDHLLVPRNPPPAARAAGATSDAERVHEETAEGSKLLSSSADLTASDADNNLADQVEN